MRYPLRAAAFAALVAAAACSSAPAAPGETPSPAPAAHYQAGIDLDFYWHPGMDVGGNMAADSAYARGLGANAVVISFPVYTDGRTVTAGTSTPPTSALAQAVTAALAQGLAVGVRPLLDEKSLGRSRTSFKPADVTAWLASYQALIVGYATAAQQAGASRFWTGAELTAFGHAPGWAGVTAAVKKVFSGSLYYAANWANTADMPELPGSGGPGVTPTADAYQAMPVPVAGFGAAWKSKASALPPGTVLSEVGIAARAGAQDRPWVWAKSGAPLDPQLQAAWFTAACDAVTADHLGGIYFWSVNVGQSLTAPPAPKTANQFTDSPGATAIKACFERIDGGS
jgi:hypothetical protein